MYAKIVLRIFGGLVGGYLAYLPILLITEYVTRGRIDSERAFYALFYPMEAPYLVVPYFWRYASVDEVVLKLVGGALLVAGVLIALRGIKKTNSRPAA
jgi:hypothetical protein